MKKTATTAVLFTIALSASADNWTGPDKLKHAEVGAAIGAIVTTATRDPMLGCAAATVAGLAKEVYDYQHRLQHQASAKDFVVTAVAGCLASKSTGLVVAPNTVMFRLAF